VRRENPNRSSARRPTDTAKAGAPVLGIVGGLASGKSTVARLLEQRGARVVDADRIGHQMLELAEVREALREAFGECIFEAGSQVSHERLAEAVFGRPEMVQKLNAIVHPRILREIRGQVEMHRKEQGVPLVVLDAALLVETNLDRDMCSALLFVETPRPLRRERAAGRHVSPEQFEKREQSQLPEEEKKERADYVVSNTGSLADLKDQVERLWPRLCRLNAAGRTEEGTSLSDKRVTKTK
jgi:dephospho-CoA kinase